jgi:AraC family transcriptional regulator
MHNCFLIKHLQQPAFELPESSPLADHRMILNLGNPFNVEQWYDGCYQQNQMETGSFTFLPVGMSRRVIWDRPIECLLVELEPVYVKRLMLGLGNHDQIELMPHYKCHDLLIYQLGLALKTELQSDGRGGKLYVESVMATLTVQLLKHHATWVLIPPGALAGFSQEPLQTVVAYIDSNLEQALSLDELASVAQMSKYYLMRLFKQATGSTLHQYVTARRIEKAKQLLAKRHLPLVDICHAVGFQSQSHFTHIFRRCIGIPPKAYRDRL